MKRSHDPVQYTQRPLIAPERSYDLSGVYSAEKSAKWLGEELFEALRGMTRSMVRFQALSRGVLQQHFGGMQAAFFDSSADSSLEGRRALYAAYYRILRETFETIQLPAVFSAAEPELVVTAVTTFLDNFRFADEIIGQVISKANPIEDPELLAVADPPSRPVPLPVAAKMAVKEAFFPRIEATLRGAVLGLIERERRGEDVPPLAREGLSAFVWAGVHPIHVGKVVMDVYDRSVREPLLEATRGFYGAEGVRWVAKGMDLGAYLERAEEALALEVNGIGRHLPEDSRALLASTAETELISRQLAYLTGPALTAAFAEGSLATLARAHKYFSRSRAGALVAAAAAAAGDGGGAGAKRARVPSAVERMVEVFEEDLRRRAALLKRAPEDALGSDKNSVDRAALAYASALVGFVERAFEIAKEAFSGKSPAWGVVREVTVEVLKEPVVVAGAGAGEGALAVTMSAAEILARSFDGLLRKGGREDDGGGGGGGDAASSSSIEAELDKRVRLVAYLDEKDRFLELYRVLLSKRVLSSAVSSTSTEAEDVEGVAVARLKVALGASLTHKLEGMIKDVSSTHLTQQAFHEHVARMTMNPLGFPLDARVLQSHMWPTCGPAVPLVLPPAMERARDIFAAFYGSRYRNRVLQWAHGLGVVVLTATFDRRYEITGSTVQAVVLLHIDTRPGCTVRSISEALQLPAPEVKKAVMALAFSKSPLIRLAGQAQAQAPAPAAAPAAAKAARKIEDTDPLEVRHDFSDKKQVKIKLPVVNARVTAEEATAASQHVDHDRQIYIDAAIVRVMKARKTLVHARLIAEVIDALKRYFTASVVVIKMRIEDLISGGFLKRDEAERGIYHYIG